MVVLKYFVVVAILLFSICSCESSSKSETALMTRAVHEPELPFSPLDDDEKEKLHDEIEYRLNRSLLRTSFNGAILIAKNGTIVYEKYVGLKQPRVKDADSIDAETPFQIASTGKTMTAAAVLKLAEDGKLNLNDSINKWFPGFPYPGITVKMLLNHRSGLPNYLYYMEKGDWDRKKLASNQDVLNTLMQWKPGRAYAPDRRFNYSNTNYVLLALIVEKASGLSFPDYMKRNIFEPLGMNHTFVHTLKDTAQVLMSYQPNNALWTLDFSDGPYGDKNIYSTPRDLLKWDQSFYTHQILSKEMIDSAFTPYSNERPGVHNYGLGWRMLNLPNDKNVYYHNGHWHGFNSAFARLVDENATIIIISNKYNMSVYTTAKNLYSVFSNYDGKADNGEE